MKSINYWSSLFYDIFSLFLSAVSGSRNVRYPKDVQEFVILFRLRSITYKSSSSATNQSSLRVEKSSRGKSTESNRDELTISGHGISRIVKGIDLHFLKIFENFGVGQSERLTPKGFAGKFYIEEKALLLLKKLYIQPKILHFYNI